MRQLTVPVLRLAVIAVLWFGFAFQPRAAEKLETVPFQGQRYISLQHWGKAKDFAFTWDKPNKTVTLASRWAKVTFLVNSKKAVVNGLAVWLTSPIVVNGGAVLIHERDVWKTIHPILYPEKLARGKTIRTIVIAAGHGGKDPGYQINKEQEKKYTLLMAKQLKEVLVASGFKVILTRETDKFVDLGEQAAMANRAGADLLINIHYNAAIETEANGVETYCLTPAGATSTNGGQVTPRSAGHRQDSFNPLLAYQMHKSLTSNCSFQDRGIRRAAFQVLREINMPGVLIEGGFLSNRQDAQKIVNAGQRAAVARALADGILSYKRLVERR